MNTFVVAGVPLESDIEILAFSVVIFVVAHFCEQWVFRLVEMLYEVDNSALVLEGDFLFTLRSLINKRNLEPTIEKCHDLQAIEHRAGKNSVPSAWNIAESGQNVTVVPDVRPRFEFRLSTTVCFWACRRLDTPVSSACHLDRFRWSSAQKVR